MESGSRRALAEKASAAEKIKAEETYVSSAFLFWRFG
jgi:hypothetical protein